MHIRSANIDDYNELCAIDSVSEECVERCDQIRYWLEVAQCCVVQVDDRVVAYGVLTQHFFGQPFIEMVMVGKAYIKYFKSVIIGSKLFSSTNMSNKRMHELFTRQGFKPSGYIDNLDEGDPEIIFYHSII